MNAYILCIVLTHGVQKHEHLQVSYIHGHWWLTGNDNDKLLKKIKKLN